jgi:hypothetical protein
MLMAISLTEAGTLLIGSVGIGVALLNQRRQLNAQMFIEFSRRFVDLLHLFPTEAWMANRNTAQCLPPRSREITECSLYCFHLIADVYNLRKGGYISNSLWVLWEQEIKRTLMGPLFVREWAEVSTEFAHDLGFVNYINKLTLNPRSVGETSPR